MYFPRRSSVSRRTQNRNEYFDGAIGLLPCVTHKYYEKCDECEDEITCGIRHAFLQIRNETVELLKKDTLEKIIKNEEKLKKNVDK